MTAAHPKPLRSLSGVVHAPVDTVWAVLADVGPHGRSPIKPPGRTIRTHDDDRIYHVSVEQDGSRVTVEVDRVTRTITIEGQWWYRAQFTVSPHHDGCVVTQQIFNIATRLRWAVRFVAKEPLAAAPNAFAHVLEELSSTR